MKLRTETTVVETSGLADATNFSMKVNGKAFRILLDGLYSDKVGAVIRELSTNAYDAHLAIGKGDVPFEVSLPTLFDPTFKVRDYGVSMTHEQTMRLISTVFESSKDDSNNQVGAFGLGSKSPFSLVDSFTLVVRKDGEKRTYSAFFGPDGVPSLALLGRDASTEAAGVEFSMTIDQKDVRAFQEKAPRILRWFPTLPTVTCGQQTVSKPTVLAEGKGWSLIKSDGYQSVLTGAHARQGCVIYPLNGAAITAMAQAHRDLLQAPILIDFPIGSLDVAASREALSYDPDTCGNIMARLNSVSEDIANHYGKAITDAPTLWEAGKKRLELTQGTNLPQALIRIVAAAKWQGKTHVGTGSIDMVVSALEKAGSKVKAYNWDQYRIRRSTTTVSIDENAEFYARHRATFAYGDETCSFYFSEADARPTYEGRRIRTDYTQGQITLFVVKDEAEQKAVLAELGHPTNWKWTRDLPAPQMPPRAGSTAKRGTTQKVEVKARKIVRAAPQLPGARKKDVEIEAEAVVTLTGDALYAITNDGKVTGLGSGKDENQYVPDFLNGISQAAELKYIDFGTPIYLISSVYQKRVEAFGQWKRIGDYVSEKAVDMPAKLAKEMLDKDLIRTLGSNWTTLLSDQAKIKSAIVSSQIGRLYELHKFMEAADLYKLRTSSTGRSYWSNTPTYDAAHLLTRLGVDMQDIKGKADVLRRGMQTNNQLQSLVEICDRHYPLIRSVSDSYGNRIAADTVIDYVLALDQYRAAKAQPATTRVYAVGGTTGAAPSPLP